MSKGLWENTLNRSGPKGRELRSRIAYGAWDPFAGLLLKMKVGEVRKFKKSYFLSQSKGMNVEDYLKWIAGKTFILTSATPNYYWIKRVENPVGTQWVEVRLGDIWFWVGKDWLNRFEVIHINYKSGLVTLRNSETQYDQKFTCKNKQVVDGHEVLLWDQLIACNNGQGWWHLSTIEYERQYSKKKVEVIVRSHALKFKKNFKRYMDVLENDKTPPEQVLFMAKFLEAINGPMEFLMYRKGNIQQRREYHGEIAGILARLGEADIRNRKASRRKVGDDS